MHDRSANLDKLTSNSFDLLVIGGGATGSGIALDAVSRGLKVALIDMQDFGGGTSSRSTKLIHGGLRYLKQMELKLVQEVGSERAIVHRIAPHLVVPEKMLLPIIKDGSYSKLLTSIGLKVYDVLAGVIKEDRRKMLNKQQTIAQEPLLKKEVVEGGGYYAEYRTDDARLTLALVKTAAEGGATVANYIKATSFIYDKEEIVKGIKAIDTLTNTPFEIKADHLVNAAGPWVDELRKENNSLEGKHLHLTKGVHIVVPRSKFPLNQSIYYDVPGGRMCFAIPRGRATYIGTTDTDYQGFKANPRTKLEDVEYLLAGVNHLFPTVNLSLEDVESSWAGLRPLIHEEGKSASEISRKDEIFHSPSGLISIAGGKLTGYRKMALRVVNEVAKKIPSLKEKSKTDKLSLIGGDFDSYSQVVALQTKLEEQYSTYGFDEYTIPYLIHNYGTEAESILKAVERDKYEDIALGVSCYQKQHLPADKNLYANYLISLFGEQVGCILILKASRHIVHRFWTLYPPFWDGMKQENMMKRKNWINFYMRRAILHPTN